MPPRAKKEAVVDTAQSKKLAAIQAACAALQAKFGKESVNYLGNKKAEPIPRIPSGSIAIDKVTGGGYPLGRIIEISGGFSSGKCLTADTMIQTINGYKKLSDIFIENNIEPFCTQKEIACSYPLINMNGEIENTTHFVMNGKRTVFCTKTKHGAVIHSTAKHPLRVLSNNGFPIWKYTNELEVGDILIGRKGDNIFACNDTITEMESSLIGLLIADGSFNDLRVGMTNSDEEILDFFKSNIKTFNEFKNVELHEYHQEGRIATELHLNCKEKVHQFYDRFNLCPSVAKDKFVPNCILNGSKQIQKAFLRFFIDCECYIGDSVISISSASYNLLHSIRLMLLNFGIESYLNCKIVKGYEQNDYWILSLYSSSIEKYINEIGFFTSARKEKAALIKIERYRDNKIPNINMLVNEYYATVDPCSKTSESNDCVHSNNQKDFKYTNNILIRLLNQTNGYGSNDIFNILSYLSDEHLLFDEIVSIEKQEEVPTFDFAMEKTHSFIAEGIINHNTTACYHAIAEAQKMFPDKWCGFVDSEYSADLQYAENIGVNVSELVVAQPDTGTDAFAMVQGMVEAGASLIIVDSVAAMLPKEEADEEDYAHQGMALQARMMSKGLRKLTAIVGKHKCVIIFTNQLRDKLNVMFGEKSVTAGGNALNYYSSIRLKFSRIGKVSEGTGDDKTVEAIETKVESIKNKTYRPYLQDKFTTVFGKGIDNDAGILDMAIEEKIIQKKGGWFAINGENVAQGLANLKLYLATNPDIYQDIKARTLEAVKPEVDDTNVDNSIDADNMTDDEIAEKSLKDDETEVGEV